MIFIINIHICVPAKFDVISNSLVSFVALTQGWFVLKCRRMRGLLKSMNWEKSKVEEREVTATGLNIPADGEMISFYPPFHDVKELRKLDCHDAVDGDNFAIHEMTNEGIRLQFFDIRGKPKKMTVDLVVAGRGKVLHS